MSLDKFQLKFEEFTLPPKCREAHLVPDEECHICGMDTWDHTVEFSFPVSCPYSDGVAYKKVCLKDYMRENPQKRQEILASGQKQ